MKNNLLSYIQYGVIAILAIIILFQQCGKKEQECDYDYYADVIAKQVRQIDSLKSEVSYLQYRYDSLKTVKQKEKVRIKYIRDTTIIEKETDDFKKHIKGVEAPFKTDRLTNYFNDSTYKLTTDIYHNGVIDQVDFLHEVKKYNTEFIPSVKTIIADPIMVTQPKKDKRPRILAGLELEFDKFAPQNLFGIIALQDNKGRIYSISKGIQSVENFKINYLHPIIWSNEN